MRTTKTHRQKRERDRQAAQLQLLDDELRRLGSSDWHCSPEHVRGLARKRHRLCQALRPTVDVSWDMAVAGSSDLVLLLRRAAASR